jgi:AcrR family transcriptional regulator
VPKQRGLSNEEASDKSRTALLEAGAELMNLPDPNPFASLRLRRICEIAGFSTATFYLHWKNMDSYCLDLGRAMLQRGEGVFLDADLKDVEDFATDADPGVAGLLQLAAFDLKSLLRQPVAAYEHLNVTWSRKELHSEAMRHYRVVDEATARAYQRMFVRMGRELRPPLDVTQLGVILQMLIEGASLRAQVDPEALDCPAGEMGNLYSLGVASLLAVLTRPVGDTHDLGEMLHELLRTNGDSDLDTDQEA